MTNKDTVVSIGGRDVETIVLGNPIKALERITENPEMLMNADYVIHARRIPVEEAKRMYGMK